VSKPLGTRIHGFALCPSGCFRRIHVPVASGSIAPYRALDEGWHLSPHSGVEKMTGAAEQFVFVFWMYLVFAIPSFIIIGIVVLILRRFSASRAVNIAVFSIASALLLLPVMLPAASIMLLPGPSFYIVADLYADHGRQYALKHLKHFPLFTILSPGITLVLSAAVALLIFPKKLKPIL
jgi:hypothetical protein